jgi:hypothetical protein
LPSISGYLASIIPVQEEVFPMPAFRAGRVGVTVGAIFVGLACGLPPGAAFAEPSDSSSDSSSESGNSESNGTNSGTDAGVSDTPTRVGPNTSDDDITKAEDAEDKAWQDADKTSADLDASVQDTIASMSEGVDKNVLQDAASRMSEDNRAILEAAQADEKAGLELLRLHEPQAVSGSISGQGATPTPQVQGLAAQHQRSRETISGAVGDRKTAVESIQVRPLFADAVAGAELVTQGLGMSLAGATQLSEYDRIMADAARAEAQATSTGQGQIDQSANINEMMTLSADERAKLQETINAQTAALRSLAHD